MEFCSSYRYHLNDEFCAMVPEEINTNPQMFKVWFFNKGNNNIYKIRKQYKNLTLVEIQAAYSLFVMANPTQNLPATMPLKPVKSLRPEQPGDLAMDLENIVSSTMDNSECAGTIDDPITGYNLLLSPDDSEAVLTLIMMAQNSQRSAISTAQPPEPNSYEAPTQDDASSHPSSDTSASIPSWPSSWSLGNREQAIYIDDTSSSEGTSSEKPARFDCDQCVDEVDDAVAGPSGSQSMDTREAVAMPSLILYDLSKPKQRRRRKTKKVETSSDSSSSDENVFLARIQAKKRTLETPQKEKTSASPKRKKM
ncbi:PREDICTED: uncharacterized protein LOC106126488 isoform X2 [Papilio xuthus]|uniref:Uncharacterized protein LOC106126488 isoform X2 n=1 Tax=Papilio xuthus TaxID=66420 RepID=A0AAJ6ZV71_PAPXU|nr:PREDICTED: uncharacterized protein LOC106126488 isoform X2 [Papilio xuthus]XP_013179642.1 PREDICTED: uncharacterized protein LOC106126488 isoform X2 [Papilio xuthus]